MNTRNFPRFLIVLSLAACMPAAENKHASGLAEFSGALERLAATVAPAVVQVQVSAWCASPSPNTESAGTLTSCRVIGSGVIVDASGYIVTNEHVIRNARRIRVMLTPRSDDSGSAAIPQRLDTVIVDANREPIGKRQVLDATVIGANRDTDIAVLKIDASGLPAIPIRQTSRGPRQGQVVLAVGSPEGLDNTMTIGIVSAVGRQPYPDYPMLYIQTDAAINPGNSGGPLLDADGQLIGINTFMLGENGRNQGLGFAVPAGVVRYVYDQIRSHGFVRYTLVGVQVQTVTPALAQGLGLSRGYGVMISDVLPGSPADLAGLRPRDIITAVDGASVSALPYYAAIMYLHDPGVPVAVTALRGDRILQFQVPAVAVDDVYDRDTSIDPLDSFIPELRIFGRPVDSMLARRTGLRSKAGIYVLATVAGDAESSTWLAAGDVIASVNGTPVASIRDFRGVIHEQKKSNPMIVQIERHGQYFYTERELQTLPPDTGTDQEIASDSKAEAGRAKR